jgi:hypothetical protein
MRAPAAVNRSGAHSLTNLGRQLVKRSFLLPNRMRTTVKKILAAAVAAVFALSPLSLLAADANKDQTRAEGQSTQTKKAKSSKKSSSKKSAKKSPQKKDQAPAAQ